MTETLTMLEQRGVLSALDRHLARTLARLQPGATDAVLLAAALVSRAVQRGDACLDLAAVARQPIHDAEGAVVELVLPEVEPWCEQLRASGWVGDGARATPLVLDRGGRLYLWRYWRYEQQLARALRRRSAALAKVVPEVLREGLDRLFSDQAGDQRLAAAIAVLRRFTVITGGPGTGKTATVVKVMALLQEQAQAQRAPWLRMVALAPTGKAAQRLSESIESQRAQLACSQAIQATILGTATTIHRALGFLPGTPTRFRHNARNPLAADVVLVDEASMVDLALMAKLVDAVADDARLILLGDKDQLASVDAGAVLGDVCAGAGRYSDELVGAVRDLACQPPAVTTRVSSPLGDSIAVLTRSWRYAPDSGIARLAHAVHAGDAEAALATLRPGAADARLIALPAGAELDPALRESCVTGFAALGAGSAAEQLEHLTRFRVLCAHRQGPRGAIAINGLVEHWLAEARVLDPSTEWYRGRPILISRNEPQVDLSNGDVGVIEAERAWFAGAGGKLRSLPLALLPPHDTVFAMTVHKSQGSEFDTVVLVLPERDSPLLTRELVYTAVTRAKKAILIVGDPGLLAAALARRMERASGLRAALAGGQGD